jgi:hypothetical protein
MPITTIMTVEHVYVVYVMHAYIVYSYGCCVCYMMYGSIGGAVICAYVHLILKLSSCSGRGCNQ